MKRVLKWFVRLADSVVLLRTHALSNRPSVELLLQEMLPQQLPLDLVEEK